MKYALLYLLIGIIISDNSLSNDRLHYEIANHKENAIKTMPNNDQHARFVEKMRRIEEDRARQVSIMNDRRLQNIEQQMVMQQIGITGIKFVPR